MRYVLALLALFVAAPAMARDEAPDTRLRSPLERGSDTYVRARIQQLMDDTVRGPRLPYYTDPTPIRNPNGFRWPAVPTTGPLVMPGFDPNNLRTPEPWETQ